MIPDNLFEMFTIGLLMDLFCYWHSFDLQEQKLHFKNKGALFHSVDNH